MVYLGEICKIQEIKQIGNTKMKNSSTNSIMTEISEINDIFIWKFVEEEKRNRREEERSERGREKWEREKNC